MIFNVVFTYGDKYYQVVQQKYKASSQDTLVEYFRNKGYDKCSPNRLAKYSTQINIYPEIIDIGQ
jgi:hypothetical protein